MNTLANSLNKTSFYNGDIKLSEGCKKLILQYQLTWVPDLIWHCQSLTNIDNDIPQKWIFQPHQVKRTLRPYLSIDCYSKVKLLESMVVDKLAFPIDHLALIYAEGVCYLREEYLIIN